MPRDKQLKGKESIGHWISFLYRQSMIYINTELADYELGSGQFPVLHVLHHQDGLSQQEISDILHLDKATTGRAIKKLETTGYIERERDENDRRVYHVILTEKGKRIRPKIRKILRRWTRILAAGFTPKEKKLLISLLRRMHQNALDYRED